MSYLAAQAQAAAQAQVVAAQAQSIAQKQRQSEAEKQTRQKEEELAAAQEDEGVGQGEEYDTFADYEPSKVQLGRRHPDQTVETSSMSAVPPPDPAYRLGLPRELIEKGLISGLQLESIVYASMRHHITLPNGRNERAGFLLGDGAGIGKGRQISGIIYENFRRGRENCPCLSASIAVQPPFSFSPRERQVKRMFGSAQAPTSPPMPHATSPILERARSRSSTSRTCRTSN
eukprot:SAG31_NODE_1409_length_8471_cov_12.764931_1_plen_231_part_00